MTQTSALHALMGKHTILHGQSDNGTKKLLKLCSSLFIMIQHALYIPTSANNLNKKSRSKP